VVAAVALGLSAAFFTRPSSTLAEQTMKFESISGKHRSRRSKSSVHGPALVESLEVRSLMTVLSPTGTISDATPTITWEAVDNATSYDLWVTDGEQRTVQFIKYKLTATNFTPTTELNLGRARAWVRANFADDTSSPMVGTDRLCGAGRAYGDRPCEFKGRRHAGEAGRDETHDHMDKSARRLSIRNLLQRSDQPDV
jgi:hypothetical protein